MTPFDSVAQLFAVATPAMLVGPFTALLAAFVLGQVLAWAY
jgi:hypothetical protein